MRVIVRAGLWMAGVACAALAGAQSPSQAHLETVQAHLTVKGTSTLHAWEVKSPTINGALDVASGFLTDPAGSTAAALQSGAGAPALRISIPAKSLHSESAGMDRTMYKALKAEAHPEISYGLKSAALAPGVDPISSELLLDTQGELTVAGVTRPLAMQVKVVRATGKITVSGEAPLKISDFGIDPPTALLGTIRTGDAITVSFQWELAAKSAAP